MISATLDSSAWIRALHFGGAPARLIGHARVGNLRIDISDPIINETMRVLRDRFQWPGELLHHTRETISGLCNQVSPVERLDVIKEDPDDNRILECAATAKSDFIVSEDKHLLKVGQFGRARIVKVAEFLENEMVRARNR